eukprot:1350068-Lingulodinium_polyedra.AAC.1
MTRPGGALRDDPLHSGRPRSPRRSPRRRQQVVMPTWAPRPLWHPAMYACSAPLRRESRKA